MVGVVSAQARRRFRFMSPSCLAALVGAALARCDEKHAHKNHHHGKPLHHIERVEPETNRHDTRHYGLHVVLHSSHRGTQILLPDNDKHIAHKRRKHHDKRHGKHIVPSKRKPVGCHKTRI